MPDSTSWRSIDLRSDGSWMHRLATHEAHALAGSQPPPEGQSDDWRSASLECLLSRVRTALANGPGVFLLRAGAATTCAEDTLASMQMFLCTELGTVIPQDSDRRLVTVVAAHDQIGADTPPAKGHRGRAEMLPHTDSAEIVSLLCVRAAMSGGETTLTSATRLHEAIGDLSPDSLTRLYKEFFFDITGKTRSTNDLPYLRRPVFCERAGRVRCHYNRQRIALGTWSAAEELTEEVRKALDLFDDLAGSDEMSFRLILSPGDILFINNDFILHGRTRYEDWPNRARHRKFLRVWLALHTE